MKKIREMIAYIFPVYISDRDGFLVIDDRRPEWDMVLAAGGVVVAVLIAIFTAGPIVAAGYYGLLAALVGGLAFAVFWLLRGAFRELYVFDRSKNSYVFTRQSVLRKEVIEGDLRQFRAVQVEHTRVDTDNGYEDVYRAVLLLDTSMLFGSSPSQPLRFKPPIFSSYSAELRIASALSKFLGVRLDGEVDVARFN